MFAKALDPCDLTAFMGIGIGKYDSFVQSDLGIQPAVAMGGKAPMVFLKQSDALHKPFLLFGWMFHALLPVVEAAAWDSSLCTEQPDGELSGKLHDYLVFFLPIGMNVFSAPTPSTR